MNFLLRLRQAVFVATLPQNPTRQAPCFCDILFTSRSQCQVQIVRYSFQKPIRPAHKRAIFMPAATLSIPLKWN